MLLVCATHAEQLLGVPRRDADKLVDKAFVNPFNAVARCMTGLRHNGEYILGLV